MSLPQNIQIQLYLCRITPDNDTRLYMIYEIEFTFQKQKQRNNSKTEVASMNPQFYDESII